MRNEINDLELMEVYKGDTEGRKYRNSIVSKNNSIRTEPAREIKTIDLNIRMTKKEFGKLDARTQREYLIYLHTKFGATISEIGKMLGYGNNSIFAVTKRLNLAGSFRTGKRKKTKEQEKMWKNFLNNAAEEVCEKVEEAVCEDVCENAACECVCETPQEKKREMTVNTLSFSCSGTLCVEELGRVISNMIEDGAICNVRIEIERVI